MNRQLLKQASALEIDEQIELVEEIWNGIVRRGAAPPLTEEQKDELDRRLADHLENPDDVIPWEDVKAAALANRRNESSDHLSTCRPCRVHQGMHMARNQATRSFP